MTETLIVTPFEKALASLDRALARALTSPDDEELRDACIQRFEYCFELAWRLLKRRLYATTGNRDEVDSLSRKGLFRAGAEVGLVDDVEAWFVYLEKRNLTSHTYNAETAREVFAELPRFAIHARDLLERLRHPDP